MENSLIIKQCKCGACARTYYIMTEEVIKDLKNKCTICKTELKIWKKNIILQQLKNFMLDLNMKIIGMKNGIKKFILK